MPLPPIRAKVTESERLSPDVARLRLRPEKPLKAWKPGQFLMLSLLGFGEAPVGFASFDEGDRRREFEVAVRAAGAVTSGLVGVRKGDFVGVRGPFGNGFDVAAMRGKDVIMVTGGCGIPPFRALIHYIERHRKDFGGVWLVYGARTPADLLFSREFGNWEKFMGVLTTIDKPAEGWTGCVGFANQRLSDMKLTGDAVALLCGPPQMYGPTIRSLTGMGLKDESIFLSFERRMKCGVGVCQHCAIDERYTCRDGPVFSYKQVKEELPDALA